MARQKKHTSRMKKRSINRKKDTSYRPGVKLYGRKKPKKQASVYHLRARQDENEKIAVLVNFDRITLRSKHTQTIFASPHKRSRIDQAIKKRFSKIKNNRAIKKIEVNQQGSPIAVYTPQKNTKLVLEKKDGVMIVFTDKPQVDNPVVTTIDKNHPFFSSDAFQAVKEPAPGTKKCFNEIHVTPDLLKATLAEIEKKGKNRNQNRVMAKENVNPALANAKKHADASCLFTPDRMSEWGHIIAFCLLGHLTQSEKYILNITKQANIDMLKLESLFHDILKWSPKTGFILIPEAEHIEKTQFGICIKLSIKTDDYIFPFEFNAQTTIQPHQSEQAYLKHILSALLVDTFQIDQLSPVKSPLALNPSVLFSKKPKRKLDFDAPQPSIVKK